METFVWCAIGAALGWLAGHFAGKPSAGARIENLLIGMFGALAGSEFLVHVLWEPPYGVNMRGVSMAVAGAVAALVLLALMRRSVGPLKATTKRKRRV